MSAMERTAQPTRPQVTVPQVLADALERNPEIAEKFGRLSSSCRREYAEWISGAKRTETQAKRVAAALEMLAQGKSKGKA